MSKKVFLALFSALLLSPIQSTMAAEHFMKLGDIAGESTHPSHIDEIDVLSWDWGIKHPTRINRGGNVTRVSKPGKGTLTFIKKTDKSSPMILESCANGKRFNEAVLTVRKSDGSDTEYVKITMKKIIITSVVFQSPDEADIMNEEVTLNFSKIKMDYQEQLPDGSSAGNVETTWKIEKGE